MIDTVTQHDGDQQSWEHFSHEADIGLRATGPTKAAVFEQMALAMTAAITDPGGVEPQLVVEVDCEAPSDEVLLVDWLNALIFEMATRRVLFGKFEVSIQGSHLRGLAHGEPVDPPRHQPTVEVKGATFTALELIQTQRGWTAQCVIDV